MGASLPLSLTGCANAGFWQRPREGAPGWRWKVGSLYFSEGLLRDDRTETLDAWIRKGWAPDVVVWP